jgi:hypothetical protein
MEDTEESHFAAKVIPAELKKCLRGRFEQYVIHHPLVAQGQRV